MNAGHLKARKTQKPKQAESTNPAAITFESMKSTKPEDLAWIGSRNRPQAKIIGDIVTFLMERPVFEVSSVLNELDGIRLIFDFDYPSDWDEYADEAPFSVVVEEKNPEGPLALTLGFSHPKLTSSDVEVETNASLFLTWLAVSHASPNGSEYSTVLESAAQDVRLEFAEAIKKRTSKVREEEELTKLLAATELVKMTIALAPRFADGSLISPQHSLFSQLQPEKKSISKNQARLKKFIALQLTPLERSVISDTLPEVFLAPPEQIRNSFMTAQKQVELANRLTYHFSDASVIGAQEILRHPYLKLVPPDLLPGGFTSKKPEKFWKKKFSDVGLQSKPNLDQGKILNEVRIATASDASPRYFSSYDQYEFPETQKTNHALNAILFALGRRLTLGEIAADLAFAEGGTRVEKSLTLKSLNVLTSPIFDWSETVYPVPVDDGAPGELFAVASQFQLRRLGSEEVGDLAPSGSCQTTLGLVALEGGYLDLDERSLSLSPVRKVVSQFGNFQYGVLSDGEPRDFVSPKVFDPRRPSIGFFSQMVPHFKLAFNAWGVKSRFELIEKLQRHPFFGIRPPEDKPTHLSARPQIHFGPGGRFSIVRHLDQEVKPLSKPWLHGLSSKGLEILAILSQGIAGFYGVEPKALASKKKTSRDFELRLTRHQGVANLILHEALHAHVKGVTTDGQKVSSGGELIHLLEMKIIALTRPTSASNRGIEDSDNSDFASLRLQDLCATTVQKKLKDFASHFLASDHASFSTLLPEGEVAIKDMYKQEAEFFLTLLDYAAVASKGEIFGRARMNLFEKMMPQKNGSLRDIQILMSASAPDLTRSQGEEFNIFRLPYNGPEALAQHSASEQLKTAISALRGLSKSGFTFFFGGRKLNELTNEDLRAELALSEKAPESQKSESTQLRSQSLNWFELHPKLFLHGKEMVEADAKRLLDEGMMEHDGQFYLVPAHRLPSLQKLGRFWQKLQQNKGKAAKGFSRDETVFQVPASEVLEMLALRASGISVIGNKRWQDICRFYDGLEHPDREFTLPSSIHAELKPYQRLGVQRLYELYRIGLGSVLADDMGLGKTLQALSFLEKLRSENEMGRVLIVVPTSLTYNWLAERDKFTPELPIMGFANKLKDKTLDFLDQPNAAVLTTYGLLQEHREFFQSVHWNVVLFDEAQNLKNISAQRTTAARALTATIKLCLTGTPLENHFGEFFSLLDLAVPGCLGNLDSFRETFVNPSVIELSDVQYLKLKTKPLLLRRTKKEILSELPDKQESQVSLEFEAKQKEIYRDIAISYNEKIQQTIATEGESKCQLQMLTALLRLRQVCSDPGALPNIKYTKTPPKREMLAESIVEIIDSGESALVFTQFLHTLSTVEADLRRLKLPTFVIHGGLSKSQRERALTNFNATNGGAILLMTLKTGGVGLNLTKASYVFHLEPWWNPAVENQATDRAHRIGQKRSVQVYRYIMRDSVEEKIEHLKAQKQKRFDAIFSETEDPDQPTSQVEMKKGSHLTKEDLSFLLSPEDTLQI